MKKLNPQCKRWPQVKTHWKQNLRWRLLLDRSWIKDGLKWYNIIKQIWQTLKNGSSKQSYQLAMNFNWDVVVNFCKYYPSYFTKPGTGSQLSLITRLGPNPLYINSWNNQNAFLTAFWWFRSTSSLHTPKVCLSIYSKKWDLKLWETLYYACNNAHSSAFPVNPIPAAKLKCSRGNKALQSNHIGATALQLCSVELPGKEMPSKEWQVKLWWG